MSDTKPDLFELFIAREFEEIETILDSAEYTKAEKVAMIIDPAEEYQDEDEEVTYKKNFFSALCMYYRKDRPYWAHMPVVLSVKVLRILGENLGNYVDELKIIVEGNRFLFAKDREKLVKVIVEEADVLTSLLILFYNIRRVKKGWRRDKMREAEDQYKDFLTTSSIEKNIYTKRSIRYIQDVCTEETKEIFLCGEDYDVVDTDYVFYKHATLLEIALHKHAHIQVIRDLVEVGGKDLLLMSDRSLIQGAIIEHDDAVEIVKLFFEVGGHGLVMTERSWHHNNQDATVTLDLFQYLNLKKNLMYKKPSYYNTAKIMNMLLNAGKKDLVMKKNEKRQSILHQFKYFDMSTFVPIVQQIKTIAGNELLSSKVDNGDTVLHTLARFYPQNNSKVFVSLEYWETLACDKDLVMIQNTDGKTALHEACENSEINAIKVLVKTGGKELVWKRDKVGNTALHLLSFRVSREKDADNFQALKHIVEAGGMEILHALNNREKKPMSPFFIEALEFEFDEENKRAKVKALEEKAELDKKAKQNIEEELKAVTKKNEDLEWKWINRKKKQRSDKELEEVVKSLKKKLKAQKKSNDILNDTITELQKEKESHIMNDKTKADSNDLLKDEIKRLQGIQQSKIEEQEGFIKTLKDERKQADLEFEVVKTLHEENKNAYEKSLAEVEKLKEVDESQQNDIRDQKEMIQNLQNELGQKDEEYKLRLHKLEEENQSLKDFNSQEKLSDTDQHSSIQEESQRLVQEVKADIDEGSSVENRELSLEEENKALKDAVQEQKQIVEEKQKENKTLKDENERLIDRIATSCMKRSREEETEEIDCIEEDEDDIHCPPSKRGKTASSSSETRASENTAGNDFASLEIEIEELINDLEYEKASHMKTLKRLKEARKALKKKMN